MITYTSGVSNNQFVVNFDCSPREQSFYGVKHPVSRTDRHGIKEGITLVESWYRINGGAWQSKGATAKFSVTAASNGVKIEAKARYELKTMGFHWDNHSYPFFYFANNAKSLRWPSDTYLWSNYARVNKDWTKHSISWSGWCQKNASATSSTWHSSAREYRNGQKGSQGWYSDKSTGSSGAIQEYRRSVMMAFRKDFYSSAVTSSGISTATGTPTISAPWSIGDTGTVVLYYKDPNNIAGRIWVRAECDGKNYDIATWDSSPEYYNDWKKTYTINFNTAFGESCRGKDVKYFARAKNNYGSQSSQVTAGPQRYNARPTTPTSAKASISGNTLTMSWNKSTDSDNDAISYCIYPYAYINGSWVQQKGTGRDNGHWTTSTSMTFNISSFAEGTSFKFRVWAYDGRIYSSNYAESTTATRGYDVKTAQFLYPKSPVISDRPRIVLSIPQTPDNAPVTTYVKWNGTWYNSTSHPSYFSVTGSATGKAHKQVFMPPSKMNGSMYIEFKTSNSMSTSGITGKTITHKSNMLSTIVEKGEVVTPDHMEILIPYIKAQASAYGVDHGTSNIKIPELGVLVRHSDANQLLDAISVVNNGINSYGYKVKYTPVKISKGDDILAHKINSIMTDLKSI